MSKKKISLTLLLAGIVSIMSGLFIVSDFDTRNNLLFLGIVLGVAGMIFKIASMLGTGK